MLGGEFYPPPPQRLRETQRQIYRCWIALSGEEDPCAAPRAVSDAGRRGVFASPWSSFFDKVMAVQSLPGGSLIAVRSVGNALVVWARAKACDISTGDELFAISVTRFVVFIWAITSVFAPDWPP